MKSVDDDDDDDTVKKCDETQMSLWNKIVYIKHYGNKSNKEQNQDEHRQW